MTHDHHAHDVSTVSAAVVTVSSTRTLDTDDSGDAIAGELEAVGHEVVAREIVSDEAQVIRTLIGELVDRDDVDAVLSTGGTGITPDDVTVEAVRPLFDRRIPGFGERFRARSVDDIGARAMLSRATAGVSRGVPVFCLPGSESGARFGTEELIVPLLGHAVGLAGGGGHHDGAGAHDHHSGESASGSPHGSEADGDTHE